MSDDTHGKPFTTAEPPPRKSIRATPYVWRDPSEIPPRRWLYGQHYIRDYISVTAAPGGIGKSSLSLVEIIAMVTGRPLLGTTANEPVRAWYINLEDPREEIERRVAAICKHYEITKEEIEGRLFLDSGDECPVCVAVETKDGATVVEPVVDDLIATMRENEIDLLVIDPFVSAHQVSENDNTKITVVKDVFARIARACSISVELIHHLRKGPPGSSGEYTVDDTRGASAIVGGARAVRLLNGMSKDQGEKADVENPRFYFFATRGKANLTPPADKADWYRIANTPLGNGKVKGLIDDGDHVGVVVKWEWPNALDSVTVHHLREVQNLVSQGRYRENNQAKDWVGHAIAKVLGLDMGNKAEKRKVSSLLKTWLSTGMFVVVTGEDNRREKRSFVEVGEWAND